MAGSITLNESNDETRIEWKINHFLTRGDNLIVSPDFTLFKSNWFLQIHLGTAFLLPFPQPADIFLEPVRMSLLTHNCTTEQHFEYRMGILKSDGSEIRTEKFELVLKPGFGQTAQRLELISRKDLACYRSTVAPDNIFTVFCTVRLLTAIKNAEDVPSTCDNFSFPKLIFFDEESIAGKITLSELKNEICIEWRINHLFNRKCFIIRSQEFALFKGMWCFEICQFKGRYRPFSELGNISGVCLGLRLRRDDCIAEHHIEYRMGIRKPDGTEIRTEVFESLIRSDNSYSVEHELVTIKDSKIFKDILVVFCTMRFLNCTITAEDDSPFQHESLYGLNYHDREFYFDHKRRVGEITLRESKNETLVEWKINNFFIRDNEYLTSPDFILFKANWSLQIEKECPPFSDPGRVSEPFIRMSLDRDYSAIDHYIEYRMGIQRSDGSEIATEKFKTVYQPRFIKTTAEHELISGKDLECPKDTLVHGNALKVFCVLRLLSDGDSAENDSSCITSTEGTGASSENSKSLTKCITTLNEKAEDLSFTKVIFNNNDSFKGSGASDETLMTSGVTKDTSTQTEASETSWLPKGTTSECSKESCISKGIHTLSENFEELYNSKRFTDVTVKVKGKEFLAHKIILSTRSEVFASMLEQNTSEKSTVIEVTDSEPYSFENFLLYLYTGKLGSMSSSNAANIFKIAYKYGIEELKNECVQYMIREMNVDSFCDILNLAVLHDESDLLATATKFFIRNASVILLTKEWQTLLEMHGWLCDELLIKFAESSNN